MPRRHQKQIRLRDVHPKILEVAKRQAAHRQSLKEKNDSNAELQRRRTMSSDERAKDAIDVMTKHHVEHNAKSGNEITETQARAEMTKVAERVESKR